MRNKRSQSFLYREIPPIKQVIFIAAVSFILMVSSRVISGAGEEGKDNVIWLIAVSFILFYIILNSVMSYNAQDTGRYWRHSIIGFVAYALASIGLATWLSGIGIDEAGTYRWILLVFAMCYLIFLGIISAMKRIVTIAQEQDKKLRNEDE